MLKGEINENEQQREIWVKNLVFGLAIRFLESYEKVLQYKTTSPFSNRTSFDRSVFHLFITTAILNKNFNLIFKIKNFLDNKILIKKNIKILARIYF